MCWFDTGIVIDQFLIYPRSVSKCNDISLQITKQLHHHADTAGDNLEKHQLPPDCCGNSDTGHKLLLLLLPLINVSPVGSRVLETDLLKCVKLGRPSYSLLTHGN